MLYETYTPDLDVAIMLATWGTFGPDGKGPLKYVRLVDCSTEHLINIRKQTSLVWSHPYNLYIDSILKSRNYID